MYFYFPDTSRILLKIEKWGWTESYFIGVNSVATDVAEALTKSLTNSMELPVKLRHPKLVNKFPEYYGTQSIITAVITVHHIPLS